MKMNSQDYTKWNLPEGSKARFGKGWISEIAYSPDGTRLAVATSMGIWLYDSQTGEEVDLLTDVYNIMAFSSIVGFSPDVKIIGSDSSDKTIRLSDAHTGKHIKTLKGHTDTVSADSITFSFHGKTIIGNGHRLMELDKSVVETYLWGADTGKHIKTIKDQSVALSADGNKIASGDDGAIHLWYVHTGKHIKTLEVAAEHYDMDSLGSIKFSPNGNKIIVIVIVEAEDPACYIDLWDVRTGKRIETLTSGWLDSSPSSDRITFSPNGNRIVVPKVVDAECWTNEHMFDLRDTATGKCIKTLEVVADSFDSIVFSPDGQIIALYWQQYPWDPYEHDPYHDLYESEYTINSGINLWSAYTGEHIGTINGDSVAFSADGNKIASIRGGKIHLWNRNRYTEKYITPEYTINGDSVAFSPHENELASIRGGEVYLWDAHTGEHIKTLKGHTYSSSSIAFSPNGKTIAGGSGSEIGLWDAHTGEHIKTLTTESMDSQPIDTRAITFSPDGKIIAAGSEGRTLKVWDVETGKHIRDGKIIAAGSKSGTLKVWDVETGKRINMLGSVYI